MVDGIVSERWGRLVRALTTREWGRRVSLGLPAHVAPAEGVDLTTLVALMEEGGNLATMPSTAQVFVSTGDEGPRGSTAAPAGRSGVERIACKGGAASETVSVSFGLVVLDCSCTASRLHHEVGVTDVADVYAQRRPSSADERIAKPRDFAEPGTVSMGPTGRFGSRTVLLYGHWGVGAPTKSAPSQPLPDMFEVSQDTWRTRDEWYHSGLRRLDGLIGDTTSIAFASNGTTSQRAGVRAFAARHPHLRVAIVQRTDGTVAEMRQHATRAHGQVLQRMALAARREVAQFDNPQLAAVAAAICDDIDRTLLTASKETGYGESLVTTTDDEAPASAGPVREAIAQVCLHHISAGRITEAHALLTSAPEETSRPVNGAPDAVVLQDGLVDWQGHKTDVRVTRVSAEALRRLSHSSCAWEWDLPAAERIKGSVNSGDYRWIEEIEIDAETDAVRRTGVLRRGRYEPPAAARAALRDVRGAQYDTVQLARMAVARVEATVAHQAEENRKLREATDEHYRDYLRQRLQAGQVSERALCDALVGSDMATTLITGATQALLVDSQYAESYCAADEDGSRVAKSYLAGEVAPTPREQDETTGTGAGTGVAAKTPFRMAISSANVGRNTPLKLRGLKFAGGGEDIDASVSSCIPDTGSCTYLAGLKWAEEAERLAPHAVERVTKLESSLPGVSGVGGHAQALYYIRLRLQHGNCELTLEDVPVVPGVPGLLLGTDVYGKGGATIRFWQTPETASDGLLADGEMTMRNPDTMEESTALPFVHRISTLRQCLSAPASAPAAAAGTGACANSMLGNLALIAAEGTATATTQAVSAVAKELVDCAVPIAYAPESLRVGRWSYRKLRVRVPASLMGDHEVCVVPLDDERLDTLRGLTIYSTIQKPDKDGYVDVVVQNTSGREIEVGLLTAVGRFQVDPQRVESEMEFTVDQVMELIHYEEDSSATDLSLIRSMVSSCRQLFSTVLGYAHGYKMSIKTRLIDENKANPPNIPNRARSRDETAALKEAVDKQLKAGLIMPCRSPFNAQPVMVRKADWTPEKPTYRMTLDFRALNALTERDAYPLSSVESNLAALGKATLFSTADLLMGFHQAELEEHDGSRLKTAFGTPWGQFCYKRMPMGLTSSPGCFMRLVDSALRGLPPGMALAYADDVITATEGDMAKHMEAVTTVFGRLIEAGFTVRCDKIHVGMRSVPYLGFIVGGEGTRPNPEKTSALLDMAMEQLIREPSSIGRFAGMIGVYSRYIPNCQLLLAPFHDMKAKGADTTKVETWRMRSGFAALKRLLAEATALARPDFEKLFYIDVDSATVGGVGMVLTQRETADDPDTHRPLSFQSHKFTDNEKAFTIRDQECFGLYKSLQQWRHLLMGARCVVRTDHKSLQWLMRNTHPDGSRVSGWALKLQEFDVEIKWVEGKNHIAADCLSRAFNWRDLNEQVRVQLRLVCANGRVEAELCTDITSLTRHQARGEGEKTEGGGMDGEDAAMERRLDDLEVMTLVVDTAKESPGSRTLQGHLSPKCAGRVALVLTNISDEGQTKVLLERHDDAYTLPGCLIERDSLATYRAQLIQHLSLTYGNGSAVTKAARAATKHRTRHGEDHYSIVFLTVIGPEDIYPAGAGLVDLATAAGAVSGVDLEALELLQCVFSDDGEAKDLSEFQRRVTQKVGRFKGMGSEALRLRELARARANIAETPDDSLWEAACKVPRITEAPTGPALCETDSDMRMAVKLMRERLNRHPTASVSVDLEGELGTRQSHVSLAQVCVDGVTEDEPQLVYVFDTHCNHRILADRGEGTLADLLADSDVVKVFHCCGGDSTALQEEYSLTVHNIFDTGIADMLLARRPAAVMRNLETVIRHWLSESVDVQMTFKGTMQFVPGMFNRRPLSRKHFVYSYEDVTYCNRLYERMQRELRLQDLVELTQVLSQQRVPSNRVDISNPSAYPLNLRIAVALVDTTAVVCLHAEDTGLHLLPSVAVTDISPVAQTVKQYAQHAWAVSMGPPPKGVAAAVNARPRRPVQIGDTLLFIATVGSCLATLAPLSAALAGSATAATHTVVVRKRSEEGTHSKGVQGDQRALFQYLFIEADRSRRRREPVANVFHIGTEGVNDTQHTLRVHLQLSCAKGRVSAELCTAIHPGHQPKGAEVNIVTGTTMTNMRGAVIVHDGELVLTLNGADFSVETTFPSHQVESGGNAREAAIRGFDLMCGSALRRGGDDGCQQVYESRSLSPQLSVMLTKAFEKMPTIGKWGNTEYFCCVLQPGTLRNFAGAFYMARQPVNGYRLTATLQKRHVGFQLTRTDTSLRWLQVFDKAALEAALARASTTESHSAGVQLVAMVLHAQAQTDSDMTSEQYTERGRESQHSDAAGESKSAAPEGMPPLGADGDFDILFEAQVLVNFGSLAADAADGAGASQHSEARQQQHPKQRAPLTRLELLDAQMEHPGTRQFIDYLRHGPSDERLSSSTGLEQSEFHEEAMACELAHDGVLLRRLKVGLRIVVPPSLQARAVAQCHDGAGHFGLNRSLQLLRDRFHWDGARRMRQQLAHHIRCCDACQRTNVLHHKAGVASLAEHGECPGDCWAMDVYKTGSESGGYDSVLDFMCLFSHLVVAEPVDSHLDAVGVCNILIKTIISTYGCPSSLRCDNASIFVSEVTRALYKVFGINVNLSAAYHHQSIGALERFHSVLKKLLAAQRIASGVDEWHVHLPLLVLAYNATVGSTGYSPFHVMFGRQPNLPIDALSGTPRRLPTEMPDYIQKLLEQMGVVWDATSQALLRNSLHSMKKMDLRYDVNEEFRAGDLVLLKKGSVVDNPKLHPKAVEANDGPYEVREVLPHGNIRLTDLKSRRIKDVVNVARLTRYFTKATVAEVEESLPRLERRWAVQRINKHRYTTAADPLLRRAKGTREIEYKVKWAGLGQEYGKWLARPYLNDIWELVTAYNDNNSIAAEFERPLALTPETREPPPRPPVSQEAAKLSHFRPTDPSRRRESTANSAAVTPATSTAEQVATSSDALGTTVSEPGTASGAARQPQQQPPVEEGASMGDAAHAVRAAAREVKRAAWLQQERAAREAKAQRLRATAARESPTTLVVRRVGAGRAFTQWHLVPMCHRVPRVLAAQVPSETEQGTVRLISGGGRVFRVGRAAARLSGTIKAMMDGGCRVEGATEDEFTFAEIDDTLMAEAVRYMEYKLQRQRKGYTNTFDIVPGQEVAQFRAACYLDL